MPGATSDVRSNSSASAPHLPSLEALALAIEVRGSHTPDHLLRARVYAVELARRLGMDDAAIETLELAGILHDVGELAVPQHILSKAGKLTAQELDKMKTHAAAGARIVERAGLPKAVARIVRGHHECWDGSGYPDALRGEAIPLGARILAVADCLAAAPPGAALDSLRTGTGSRFDPRIAQIAASAQDVLERAVRHAASSPPGRDFRTAIGAARREERLLSQLIAELGTSLSLPETLSSFDVRLRALISYDCIAVYQVREGRLSPLYVFGQGAQLFSSLEIPTGEGPSGVAALTGQPVLNGNPWADAAHGEAPEDTSGLRSTLALPLECAGESVAIVALYHSGRNAFSSEDLRLLLAIRPRLTLAVEHAIRQESSGEWTPVDALTGLPGRRALFQRLDAEIARCRRKHVPFGLLICEVDGLSRAARTLQEGAIHRLSREVAAALRRTCQEGDCVVRIEDTFVLGLAGFEQSDLPARRFRIQSLLAVLSAAHHVPATLVPRIAAACFPQDGTTAEDLYAAAALRLNALCSS